MLSSWNKVVFIIIIYVQVVISVVKMFWYSGIFSASFRIVLYYFN